MKTSKGKTITWFTNTGIVYCHGERTIEKELAKHIKEKSSPPSLKVFIVHGHDSAALEQLELILHKLKLEPYVLQNTSGNGSTIIEALETEICTPTRSIKFGIVLLTPDDMGYAKSAGATAAKPRARQNVILEMGMLMSALSRKNVAILIKEDQNIEKPSDMSGIMYIPFQEHVKETVPKLTEQLIDSGYY
ncbi:nucleotide-binding protein [Bartonella sp. 220]|uniref:nucleotide-binding protein n=1 Tax=Bartonella sp. 220B TaxID=2967260 RepID=UPI0022A92A70|nr:nucleotide-binding protein [Bartonella sp. 220B]MCZ2157986.1 nucleotide-binding protein [Bartonella sp. 220B]